jgi:hypothetical protein
LDGCGSRRRSEVFGSGWDSDAPLKVTIELSESYNTGSYLVTFIILHFCVKKIDPWSFFRRSSKSSASRSKNWCPVRRCFVNGEMYLNYSIIA